MSNIKIVDKEFQVYITEAQIAEVVNDISSKLNNELSDKNPIFLCTLNGAFMFASDLLRNFNFPCEVSFIKLASYQGTSSTEITELIGIKENLENRTIVIIEDIIDTGKTINHLIKYINSKNPLKILVVSLFLKSEVYNGQHKIDYFGINISNEFIVGYGLDYNGYGRNLRNIYKLIN